MPLATEDTTQKILVNMQTLISVKSQFNFFFPLTQKKRSWTIIS